MAENEGAKIKRDSAQIEYERIKSFLIALDEQDQILLGEMNSKRPGRYR
jgi:hypothetical protein